MSDAYDYNKAIYDTLQADRDDAMAVSSLKWTLFLVCFVTFLIAVILNVLNARLQYAYLWDFMTSLRKPCGEVTANRIVAYIQFPWFAPFLYKPFLNPITAHFLDILIASGRVNKYPDVLCHGLCEDINLCQTFWREGANWWDKRNKYNQIIPQDAPIVTKYRDGDRTLGDALMVGGMVAVSEWMNTYSLADVFSTLFAAPVDPKNGGCGTSGADKVGDIVSNAATGAFLGASVGAAGGGIGSAVGLVIGGVLGGLGGWQLNRMKESECSGN
jgi:ABC-type dipeptide/oligopeptide/nickel transport system permease subunit